MGIGAGALGDGVSTVSGCGAATDDAATDACFVDLVDKSFALTFTSKLNQSYTTKPIIVTKITGSTQAAAETATATAVHDALHQLPNYVVDGCTVTCTYEYAVGVSALYPSVKCDIGFNGASVAGPQYLLEVEADKCDSGCTPQLSSPVQLKSAQFATTGAADFKTTTTATVDTAGIDDTATTLPVTAAAADLGDGTNPPALPFYIQIVDEVLKVTAISGEDIDVTRGAAGTTAAEIADGATISTLSAGYDGASPSADPLSHVIEEVAADYNSFECGRRGKCDYSSGECECFEGYMGDRCQTQTALI